MFTVILRNGNRYEHVVQIQNHWGGYLLYFARDYIPPIPIPYDAIEVVQQ